MEEWAIELIDVSRGDLTNLNIKINPGERVLVLGPAGGLSIELCQSIMNFLNLDGGKIRVFGRNHRTNEARTKLLLGYVGGEINFYPEVRADQIARLYSPHYSNWDEKKWEELKTSLKVNTADSVRKWKEGDKERLQLALALARSAEVLIFAGTAGLAWQYRNFLSPEQTILLEGNGAEKWLKNSDRVILFGDRGNWLEGSRKELGQRMRRVEIFGSLPEDQVRDFFWELKVTEDKVEGISSDYEGLAAFMERDHPDVNWKDKNVDLAELSRRLGGGGKNHA